MKYRRIKLIIAMSAISLNVSAGTPPFSDARSYAMGGTGIASSRPVASSFHNPALIATNKSNKRFDLLLPSFFINLADEDDLIDDIDRFQDDEIEEQFEYAIDDFNANPSTVTLQGLLDTSEQMDSALQAIDEDTIRADFGFASALQYSGDVYSFEFFVSASTRIVVDANYEDTSLFQEYISEAQAILDGNIPSTTFLDGELGDNLQSNVRGTAAMTLQIGLSVARELKISGHTFFLGITPKMVDFRTYDITESVNEFESDDVDDDQREESQSQFNLDIGVAKYFGMHDEWKAGLSIINLIPMDIKTKEQNVGGNLGNIEGRKVKIDPKVTVGIAYLGGAYTLAADLDLTENSGFGGENDEQFLGLGAEYVAWDVLQLRAGLRHNMGDGGDTAFTLGFGLSFGMTLDFAAMYIDERGFGGSMQIGGTF